MSILWRRRLWRLSTTVVAAAAIYWIYRQSLLQLKNPAFLTGWILLGLMFVLVLFNARKKLPFLPLGSARAWAQFHYYLGFLLIAVFVWHQNRWLPSGAFEWVLYVFFWLEVLSGVIGLYLSRTVPKTLNRRGEPVLFERIASFRHQLREQIETLVADSVHRQRSTALTKFYQEQLMPYLVGVHHKFSHAFDNGKAYKHWEHQFNTMSRYLDEAEIEVLQQIRTLFFKKIDLDFHYSGMALLRTWLFVHIPLAYVLFILVLFHVWIVHSFFGYL